MRLRDRSWGRNNGTVRLRNDVLSAHRRVVVTTAADGATAVFIEHTAAIIRSAVAATASTATHAAAAATALAPAARVVAVTIARVPKIRRIAVEVAPITFAAISAPPCTGHKQGEYATQRSAMPATTAGALTARIAARIAAGAASSARSSTARPATDGVAARVTVTIGYRSPGCANHCTNRTMRRPACWATAFAATVVGIGGTALAAGEAWAIAEDRLQ